MPQGEDSNVTGPEAFEGHGFQDGQSVRFSPRGEAKVRSMPEAWGLHRALSQGETGEVVDFFPADDETPDQVSVEFPSGGAYNWDADCFEPAPQAPPPIPSPSP